MLPGRCGISDPALLLAGDLERDYGIDSVFAVLNSRERASIPHQTVYCSASRLVENCLKFAGSGRGAILVHLSGYGYSADGAPAELAQALAAARSSGKFQIGVYFHELFARGRLWQSAFWQGRRQQKVLRAIAAQADLQVTNIGVHAEWLARQAPAGIGAQSATAVRRLPVFATIGEAEQPLPPAARRPALAVFGLRDTRRRAYRELPSLGRVLRVLGVEEIVDAGPECATPDQVLGIPVTRLGEQPAEHLRNIFSGLRFGLAAMPAYCLAKSSIFANFCSEGLIPVVTDPFAAEMDGLIDGVHAISARSVEAAIRNGLESCSQAAWRWYQGHSRRVHAAFYAEWLGAARKAGTDSFAPAITDAPQA